MKTTTLLILVLFLGLHVLAQKKATDRELANLRGNVKYLSNEYPNKNKTKGSARTIRSEYFYERDGRLAEILYAAQNSKQIYSLVDGFKTFKEYKIKEVSEVKTIVGTTALEKEKPIEEPEKLTAPDKRFDYKYLYEYDSQGRVVTEREFGNNNKLYELIKYEYDGEGRVRVENVNDTVALTKFEYKYDRDGNLVETVEDRNIKGPGFDSKSRTVYSDYKFDAQNNWIERKDTEYSVGYDGKPTITETFHFRTIKYH